MSKRGPVLVVDDDFDVREALLDVLESFDFDVRGASDGVEALWRCSRAGSCRKSSCST